MKVRITWYVRGVGLLTVIVGKSLLLARQRDNTELSGHVWLGAALLQSKNTRKRLDSNRTFSFLVLVLSFQQGLSPIQESLTEDDDEDDDDDGQQQQEQNESLASSSSSFISNTSDLESSHMLDFLLESFIQKLQQQAQVAPVMVLVEELHESVRQVICQHPEQQEQRQHQHATVQQEASSDNADNNDDDDNNTNTKDMKMRLVEMENDWLWSVMMPELVQQLCDAHNQIESGQIHLNVLKQVMAALGHGDSEQEQQQRRRRRRIDKLELSSVVVTGCPHVVNEQQEEEEEEQKSPAANENDDDHHRLGAYPNVNEEEEDKSRSSDNNDGKLKGGGDDDDHCEKASKRRCWWSWKFRLFRNHRRVS